MAWLPTLLFYATKLRIEKFIDGTIKSGYPKTYSILGAFSHDGSNFSAITVDGWQKLGSSERSVRITAFKSYVSATEGVDISDIQTNIEYYEVEEPGAKPILIYGTLPMQGHHPVTLAHGTVQEYYAHPEAYFPIADLYSDTPGAFSYIWEVTEEEYEKAERPWMLALVEGIVFKVVPKPTFADAVANGITFDDGSDWEGLA